MANAPSFGQLNPSQPVGPHPADAPFRLAVLGDFSGRAGRAKPAPPAELVRRKPVTLDPDDLDPAVAALAPAVSLGGLLGSPVRLSFTSFDDFHPDALFRAADKFSDLDDRDSRADYMKAILRHPHLKPLEAAWRGLDWLAKRSRKGDRRSDVILYDITLDELAAAVNATDDLAETAVHQLLVGQAVNGPKGKPWSALVGLYPFRATAAHAQVLGRLAKIAADAGGPFLAGLAPEDADPAKAVPEADAEAWAELRALPEAALLGLAAPRFLLRVPFGENTRSIEAFDFEEFRGDDDKPGYVWGDPGLAVAGVLMQGYLKSGWAFQPTGPGDLGGMPAHSYRDEDGDEHLTTIERWLDKKGTDRLTGLGVMSLLAVRGRDALKLERLHAVASPGAGKPPTDLYGRWGTGAAAPPPRSGAGVSVAVAAPPAEVAAPPPPPPAEDAIDPELAALMAGLEEAPPPPPPPAEDAIDPELADLLKGLESS